jgi:hypothetical protein
MRSLAAYKGWQTRRDPPFEGGPMYTRVTRDNMGVGLERSEIAAKRLSALADYLVAVHREKCETGSSHRVAVHREKCETGSSHRNTT